MGQRRAIAAMLGILLAACGSNASRTPAGDPATASVPQSASPSAASPSSVTAIPSPTPTATAAPTPTPAPLTGELAGLTYFDIRPDGAVTALLVGHDGSTSELITIDASDAMGTVVTASWSPDGSTLLFAVGNFPFSHTTWVVPADGGEARRLPVSGFFVDWSPDSRSVLVREAVHGGVVPPGAVPHWIVEIATAEVRELQLVSVTDWLPDGSFLGSTPVDGSEAAVVLSPAGEQTVLFVGNEPRLSPSGDRIAFTRYPPAGEALVGVASRDGTSIVIVGRGRFQAWSPDGSQLAYLDSATDGSGGLQLVLATASGERTGAFPMADPTSVAWSPDGSFVVVSTGAEGGQLTLVGLDRGAVTSLTGGSSPVWRIAATR